MQIVNEKLDFSTGENKKQNLDVGIKECTEGDFKNRGNDSQGFNDMIQARMILYCIKNPNLVTLQKSLLKINNLSVIIRKCNP